MERHTLETLISIRDSILNDSNIAITDMLSKNHNIKVNKEDVLLYDTINNKYTDVSLDDVIDSTRELFLNLIESYITETKKD